jgi:hypothetical protein
VSLDGIFFANGAPPDGSGVGEIGHGGPIGEIASEHDAGVTFAVEKFGATLHPIFCVETHHQAGLIVERGVLAIHASFENKVSAGGQVEEMAVVGDIAVKRFAPEVGFGTTMKLIFSTRLAR